MWRWPTGAAAADSPPDTRGSHAATAVTDEAAIDAWIAALATFLLDEDHSGRITGRAIAADGVSQKPG